MLERASRAATVVAGVLIVAMVAVTVVDVAARNTDQPGVPGLLEGSEVALVVIALLGMAGAERTRTHVRTDLLTSRLAVGAAQRIRIAGLVLSIVVVTYLVWATAQVGFDSFQRREYNFGIYRVPVWPAKIIIPIGMALFALTLVASLRRVLGLLRNAASAKDESGEE